MPNIKKLIKRLLIIIVLVIITLLTTNLIVINSSKNKTYNTVKSIPKNNVGLILGANKYVRNGCINLYYKYRLESAIKLYKANKINYIIISGDNSTKDYDEPNMFKTDLIKNGIPEQHIFLDFAGFRTLDSVVRAKAIFGQENITIISQEFHNQRAIYLAQKHGLHAIGFNAKNVSKRAGLKTNLREYLAKTKAVIDVLIHKEPKFYGPKIKIPNAKT